jgi:nucleoside triphosphate pyrophosphatase
VRRLVLASTSPQRRAILDQLGLPFRVEAPAYEERALDLDPIALVEAHSRGKATSVSHRPGDGPVLGVDTAVVIDDLVLGKPGDAEEARAMLRRLAGRRHEVVSGLTLVGGDGPVTGHAVTGVTFRPVDGAEIDGYVATGEWRGRAAGYAIQGRGARLVARVEGDYLNVVGLPAALLLDRLHDAGFASRE